MENSLSTEQVEHFLRHIDLPAEYRPGRKPDLDFLANLQAYYICTIPYDNLGLHYSKDAQIPLDVQSLYRKCMSNGRGGYCMENAIFFNHVLRSLSFNAHLTGARARPRVNGVPQGSYTGWMHVVNIVTFASGTKHMVDVGFGGDMATKPLPLLPDTITPNIGTQEMRLAFDCIPEATSGQKLWIYQYRNAPAQDWNSAFCFTEVEFLMQDLDVLNFHTSQDPRCFQKYTVLLVKFLRDEGGVFGKVMLLNGEVKRNLGGKTELLLTCGTEDERVEALRKWFGVTLTAEEREGITGRVTELGKTH